MTVTEPSAPVPQPDGLTAGGANSWAPGHRDGLLDVSLHADLAGRTSIRRLHQRFPIRTTVPFYLDPQDRGMAFVYVQNPTGGVFEGDRLLTEVEVGPQARVHLTTQSATKVFTMSGGKAVQTGRFRIAANGFLENLPDMVIPQAHARLEQRNIVDLAPTAAYIGAEVVAPGRLARGERFEYDEVDLITSVSVLGSEKCVDVVRLRPAETSPSAPGLLGGHDYLVTMLVAAPGRELDPGPFDEIAAGAGGDDSIGGAGALPNDLGVSIRVLTRDSMSALRAHRECWAHARRVLRNTGLPRCRK